MLPDPYPLIDVSVDDVVLLCLAHIYRKCSSDTPHLLFALLTTSRLDTFLHCLLPMLVFVMHVVNYMDLILTPC